MIARGEKRWEVQCYEDTQLGVERAKKKSEDGEEGEQEKKEAIERQSKEGGKYGYCRASLWRSMTGHARKSCSKTTFQLKEHLGQICPMENLVSTRHNLWD